jgi:hypothetical protein
MLAHYIQLIKMQDETVKFKRRRCLQLIHAGQSHGPHSKLLKDCHREDKYLAKG